MGRNDNYGSVEEQNIHERSRDVVDYFDTGDDFHLRSYFILLLRGKWPSTWQPKGVYLTYSGNWMDSIAVNIANRYLGFPLDGDPLTARKQVIAFLKEKFSGGIY